MSVQDALAAMIDRYQDGSRWQYATLSFNRTPKRLWAQSIGLAHGPVCLFPESDNYRRRDQFNGRPKESAPAVSEPGAIYVRLHPPLVSDKVLRS